MNTALDDLWQEELRREREALDALQGTVFATPYTYADEIRDAMSIDELEAEIDKGHKVDIAPNGKVTVTSAPASLMDLQDLQAQIKTLNLADRRWLLQPFCRICAADANPDGYCFEHSPDVGA